MTPTRSRRSRQALLAFVPLLAMIMSSPAPVSATSVGDEQDTTGAVATARIVEPVTRELQTVGAPWPASESEATHALEVVDVGDGVPGGYDDVDVTGAAVLMDHTTTPATWEKVAYAHALGAAAVLVVAPSEVDLDAPLDLPARGAGPYGALQRFQAELWDLRFEELVVLGVDGGGATNLRQQLGEGDVRIEARVTDAPDTLAAPAASEGQPQSHRALSVPRQEASWEAIGPNAAYGYFGFSTDPNSMAVAPTDTPAVFLSGDRAATWREVRMPDILGGTPREIVVSADGDIIYLAVVGGPGVDPSYQGRIMRSGDGGETWAVLPGPDEQMRSIAVHDSGEILAMAGFGNNLRLADDEGQTLREVPSTWGTLYDLHWIGDDLFMATTGEGLMVLRDAAGANPPPPQALYSPGVLGFALRVAGDADTIVVAPIPGGVLYASFDDGESFEEIHNAGSGTFQKIEVVGDTISAIQSTGPLWVSEDLGETWEDRGRPVDGAVNLDIGRWLAPDPSEAGAVYISASGAGVYRSDAPGEYARVGIPAADVYSLTTADGADGEAVIAGTFRDTFRQTLPAEPSDPFPLEWESSGGEGRLGVLTHFLGTSHVDRSVVYKTHLRAGGFTTFVVLRSDDGGATWEESSPPQQETPTALLVHPADDTVYVAYSPPSGLMVSPDGGETWSNVSAPRLDALAGDPTDPDRIWGGNANGLYVSNNGGASFEQLSDVRVHAIAVDPNDPERLVVAGMETYVSTDGGQTLQPAENDLDLWVSDLAFTDDDSGRVFAATEWFIDAQGVPHPGHGVLASADHGASWEPFSDGLVNPNIWSLALSEDGRQLFAGAYHGSVHRISLDPQLVELDVTPSSAALAPGETVQFTATAVYDDDSSIDVTGEADWVSSDAEVTVDDAGLAAAVAEGSARISATFEGESDAAVVTVTADGEEPPPGHPELVGVVVSPSTATIGVGGVVQLSATAVYDDNSEADVTQATSWISHDETIAMADDVGLVTGLAEGAVEVTASFAGESDTAFVTVDAAVEPGPEGLVRISAPPGRVEVAIAASVDRFDDGAAGAVVLARADEYPDALAGTPLAADRNAPLLLTSSDTLLANVADELDRVLAGSGTVYLLGGVEALDVSVQQAVAELGYPTVRLGGETRFETSGVIADALGGRSQVLITTGLDFPDALTAGAAAAAFDGVVLLSAGDLPTPVVDAYLDGFTGDVTAIGGPATRAYPEAQGVMGATRDETAVAVAEAFFPNATTFGVARADDYPDALAGGAHLAGYQGPLLLSYTNDIPAETARWVTDTVLTGGFVYGGTQAISEAVFTQLEALAF